MTSAPDPARSTRDRPNVIAPPPLIFLAFFAVGWLADGLTETAVFAGRPWMWAGGALAAGGLALALSVIMLFRRARTAIEPWKPTTALVTGGPFRFSRNPTYLAMALVHAGAAVMIGSPTALALLVPALVVVDIWVVRREERYLQRKFGASYETYRKRVRRWL